MDADADTNTIASATNPKKNCKERKGLKFVTPKGKKMSYCKWLKKDPQIRCNEEEHKKIGRKVKWLKPLEKCKCTCREYIQTKAPTPSPAPTPKPTPPPTASKTRGDGCPFYDTIKGVSTVTCTGEEEFKVCPYEYVFHGCSFDDLGCSYKSFCMCLYNKITSIGKWDCGSSQLPGLECEPTRPPRRLGGSDKLNLRLGDDDETDLPEPGTTCNPDEPLPKPR